MNVILSAVAAEKAIKLIESTNTIVLVVDRKSTKSDIKKEVEELFSVKVEKVNTEITPRGEKRAFVRLSPEYKASDLAGKLGIF
ncbi:50S ribosomal protein L23 [Sulfolobus metallicus DSM 6482 = JCM 9184]|jgi:large subunit ribosomal protein L23|uniref:Large ribosomal subunit protein uL23 n=1 Tax=Sulfuracidifex metallicus DSM 6482 = JCM 9184 TaxID=523847 RepID=A0A6A9QLI3_SULME|nr:50S ribosomal protein L23 [Sulfuracidifex metallicus]MUN28558.1 50S ribosomal protein L23 [Sulfuracidifex metallicus DSM 6482 = JCM 9184]